MAKKRTYPEEMIPINDIPEALRVGAGLHPDYGVNKLWETENGFRINRMDLENFGRGNLSRTFQTRANIARQKAKPKYDKDGNFIPTEGAEADYVGVARNYLNITGNEYVNMPLEEVNWESVGKRASDGDPVSLNIIRRATQNPMVTYFEDKEFQQQLEHNERMSRFRGEIPEHEMQELLERFSPNRPYTDTDKAARLILSYQVNGIKIPDDLRNDYPKLTERLSKVNSRDGKRMLNMKPDPDGKIQRMFLSKLKNGVDITEYEKNTYPTAYMNAHKKHYGKLPSDSFDTTHDDFINSVLDKENKKYTTSKPKDVDNLSKEQKVILSYMKEGIDAPEQLIDRNSDFYLQHYGKVNPKTPQQLPQRVVNKKTKAVTTVTSSSSPKPTQQLPQIIKGHNVQNPQTNINTGYTYTNTPAGKQLGQIKIGKT